MSQFIRCIKIHLRGDLYLSCSANEHDSVAESYCLMTPHPSEKDCWVAVRPGQILLDNAPYLEADGSGDCLSAEEVVDLITKVMALKPVKFDITTKKECAI